MEQINWRPSCKLNLITLRAELLRKIRDFFYHRGVLEVETPLLGQYSGTAVHLEPILVTNVMGHNQARYLQTSPEYAMKRLLAAGAGDLFQICKAFRDHEIGNLHNPEFTMLEWYRVGFDYHQLMHEVVDLLIHVLADPTDPFIVNKLSYRKIFMQILDLDPMNASLMDLKQKALSLINLSDPAIRTLDQTSKGSYQELLFTHYIEPTLVGLNKIWVIYDFPPEQAALAKINLDPSGIEVAQRFEVYINRIELANGYDELLDPEIQHARFSQDLQLRKQLLRNQLSIDPYFMEALTYGLPDCSGVALGIDRLLMVKSKTKQIQDVLCFPWEMA